MIDSINKCEVDVSLTDVCYVGPRVTGHNDCDVPFTFAEIDNRVRVKTPMPSTSNSANSSDIKMGLCVVLLGYGPVLMTA